MDADKNNLVCGWRELSLAVGNLLGSPVGVGQVRWAVESSGLSIGHRLGAYLVFDVEDVTAVAGLVRGRTRS